MSGRKSSLLEIIVTRLSQGSVPIDGMYWFERTTSEQPKARDAEAGSKGVLPSSPATLGWRM